MRFLRDTELSRGVSGRFRLLAALLASGSLFLTACADGREGDAAGSGGGSSSVAIGAEEVAFGETLAQIRGHLAASLELLSAGDTQGAAVHAGHPVEELMASVRGELDEHGSAAGDELQAALEENLQAIERGASLPRLSTRYARVAAITEEAEAAVVGEAADTSAYLGSVVAALLATAAHEYEEAIGPDGVRLLFEYQDAYGFLQESQKIYESVVSEVEEFSEEEAEEIAEAFEDLERALPSVEPPTRLASTEDVEVAAGLVAHELEETVSARVEEEVEPEEVVAEIERLLDEIVASYQAGEAEEAAELSAEAYLENYEVIEADVIEHAPDVNSELEPLLGADLRRRIQEGAPASEIADMTAEAKRLLGEALAALSGEEEHG